MNHSRQIRLTGTAYAVGGIMWFLVAFTSATLYGGDAPSSSAAFIPIEAVWVITQALLLYGFMGVLWSGGVGNSRWGMAAFGLALLGHGLFLVAEIHSLLTRTVSDLLALAALVSAFGLLLTGVAALRAKRFEGWTRWMPLLTGLYPFLVMFPFIFIADEPNLYAIGGWGILRLLLGLALRRQTSALPTRYSLAP